MPLLSFVSGLEIEEETGSSRRIETLRKVDDENRCVEIGEAVEIPVTRTIKARGSIVFGREVDALEDKPEKWESRRLNSVRSKSSLARSLVLRYFERIFHHCFLQPARFLLSSLSFELSGHPRVAPIISATVSGVHGRQWKSPCRTLPLRVLLPSCSRQTIPLFFRLVAAEPFPGKLPRHRQYDRRRRCSLPDRATTNPFSPLTPLSRSPIPPSTAFPTRRGKKNRTELFPIRIERGARNSSLHPSKSVRYVNRGGNRGEDLDPFTPPPSLFR